MDKIEKIRQEIERLLKVNTPYESEGYRFGLLDILSFIDNLSEEHNKSLEEEIKNYFQGYWPGTDTAEQCNTDLHFTPPAIIRLASHFTEWQKERMMEEAVETELYWDGDFLAIDLNMAELGYSERDKVRIIILPKEDKK